MKMSARRQLLKNFKSDPNQPTMTQWSRAYFANKLRGKKKEQVDHDEEKSWEEDRKPSDYFLKSTREMEEADEDPEEEEEEVEEEEDDEEEDDEDDEGEDDEVGVVGVKGKVKEEVEFLQVREKKRKAATAGDDEVAIVQVTPPSKKAKGGVKKGREVVVKREEMTARDLSMASELYKTPYKITTTGCYDGTSTLSRIPGGFIDHWILPSYIKRMHDKLLDEMTSWESTVRRFLRHCKRNSGNMFKSQLFDDIRGVFDDKISPLKVKIGKMDKVVLHSMCERGIHDALTMDRELIRLIYFFCQSNVFHVDFVPNL